MKRSSFYSSSPTSVSPPNCQSIQALKRHCGFAPNMSFQTNSHHHAQSPHNTSLSPFKDPATLLHPLSDQIASSIKYEVAYPTSSSYTLQSPSHTTTTSTSPSASTSSLSTAFAPHHHNHHHHNQHQNQHNTPSNHNSSPNKNAHEQPLMFTLAQTQAICERVIRDRELKLREEYDRVLHKHLAEQHETFVKYTQDNIHRIYNDRNAQLSYLS